MSQLSGLLNETEYLISYPFLKNENLFIHKVLHFEELPMVKFNQHTVVLIYV